MDETMFRKQPTHILAMIALVGMTFLVYAKTFNHDFLMNWDDSLYVVDNEAIRGITWEHLKDAFTRFYIGNYAPIHIISYMIDYSLWGLKPGGFIFSNVLIHCLNGILFYALVYRMHRGTALAILAAFVFLLHPVQVESVAWISQRKNILAMFFFLASIHLYLSYHAKKGYAGNVLYGFSVLAFVLAVLSKSVAIVLPVIVVLYDLCYRTKPIRWSWIIDKIPYAIIAGVALFIALKSQMPEHDGGRISYAIEGPQAVFFTMLTVLVRYFTLIVWPVELSALYMPPMRLEIDATVAWSAILAVALIAMGIYLYRKRRDVFFWYILFFIGLMPVAQIVTLVTLMNDRYLYFPILGAATCYGLAAFPAGSTISSLQQKSVAVILCALVIPLPWLSWQRTAAWSNDLSLWADTAEKTPNSTLAWNGLGMSNVDAGRFDQAIDAFLKALAIDPDYELALNNIGALYNSKGRMAEARPYLLRVTSLFPDSFTGFMNLGINYFLANELQNAELTFKKALALKPQSPDAYWRLGHVYLHMKKLELAKRCYLEAIDQGGNTAQAEYGLARVDALQGNHREALEHLEAALRMGYDDFANIKNDAALASLRGLDDFLFLLRTYSRE
jgi:tetratricopeptide (TPR) repeat protein